MESRREDALVRGESGSRHQDEAPGRLAQRCTMSTKAQVMMTRERHAESNQPAGDVRHERGPSGHLDRRDDSQPVHRGRRAADGNEPEWASGLGRHAASSTPNGSRLGGGTLVCICADDYGLNEGINTAIQRLVDLGRVHATGVLVGAPASKAGNDFLRHLHAQDLDVGLHLDFTEYPQVLDCPSALRSLIAQSYLGRLDRSAVRTEIRAQLNAFEQALGRAPAFVDGHQHVHQLPTVRDELLAEIVDRYGNCPPWIRCTRQRSSVGVMSDIRGWVKAATISALGSSALTAAAQRERLAQNGALLGVYDFSGGENRYLNLLRTWLSAACDGDLLMCHPGLGAECVDALGEARKAEYQVLASGHFKHMLEELGVVLLPMSQILDDAG